MKTFQIKPEGIKFNLFETAEDLPAKRWLELRAYLVQKTVGVPIPDFHKWGSEFIKGFDNNSKSEMLIAWHNYMLGLTDVKNREDADLMIFAIICNEEGEETNRFDPSKAKEKLERMYAEGLTIGVAKENVDFFIDASPILSMFSSLTNLVPKMN